jgi:hypothetical protein
MIEQEVMKMLALHPIEGCRFNVVRRAAHKSVESMLKKVGEDQRNGRIGEWFTRFEVRVTADDLQRFQKQCLMPILENLCDDWEWWSWCHAPFEFPHPRVLVSHVKEAVKRPDVFNGEMRRRLFPDHNSRHFLTPYFYSPLLEGGSSDLDHYISSGSETGLQRTKDLFPELE